MALTSKEIQQAYYKMQLIRKFEEAVHQLFLGGELHGTTHLYIGQEACAVGASAALTPQDFMTTTHRGHGHTLAMGGEVKPMMGEILGKETGYCKGKGGSMHIGHISKGHLGANGVVGGGQGVGVGSALAQKMKGESGVTISFFGDGSTNEGSFHESLNLASIWALPLIFFCENNGYGLSTPTRESMNIDDIALRASSYGIPGVSVDGNNFFRVYEAVKKARHHAVNTGPILLVCDTYRYMGHSKSDNNGYRPEKELGEWKKKDPLKRLEEHLLQAGTAQEILTQLEEKASEEIQQGVAYARQSKAPNLSELSKHVYA